MFKIKISPQEKFGDDCGCDDLLNEARVKDIKAKYPELTQSDWIDWARKNIAEKINDKAVSKYLLYWAKAMDVQFKGETAEELKGSDDVMEIAKVMLDLIAKFEANQSRLKEKDIYKYDVPELEKAMEEIGISSRAKKAKEKEQAIEGSEIVYEEDDMFAVRPYTEGASCFYGTNTRWCISATQSRNYFAQYTEEGKGFIMVRMENLPEDDDDRRVALVFDQDGDFDEAYDAPDNQMGYKEVRDVIARNWSAGQGQKDNLFLFNRLEEEDQDIVQKILDKLMDAGSSNILDNPPESESIEERLEELEQRYESLIDHAYFTSQAYDDSFYFDGGVDIQLDTDKLTAELDDQDWRDLADAADEIRTELDRELSIYASEVDIEEDGRILIRIDTDNFEVSLDGYERFLEELEGDDKRYKGILRLISKEFVSRGWMGGNNYDSFAEQLNTLSEKLTNFTISQDSNLGDEEIVFKSNPFRVPGIDYGFLKDTLKSDMSNPTVNDKISRAVSGLNSKIISVLKKQLPLPGIPQAKLKEFTIPEMLKIRLKFHDGSVFAQARLTIDDVEITKDSIDMTVDVVNFIDNNFQEIVEMVIKVVQSENENYVKQNSLDEVKNKIRAMIEEKIAAKLAEKKDACYYKVKSRYKVWPSAYASGALVKCRKVGAKNWGNKSKKANESHCNDEDERSVDEKRKLTKKPGSESNLGDWFKRKGEKGSKSGWVDCNTCRKDKKTGRKKCKACGRSSGEKRAKFPKCRPTPGACSDSGNYGKKSKAGRKG